MSAIYVIAEAGVNHNGSVDAALRMINVAAESGADAVKFQTFQSGALASRSARKALYQGINTGSSGGSQLEMLQKLELPPGDHLRLLDHCRALKIDFLSTPFDSGSLRFLVRELGMEKIKISSGDLTNAPFLLEVAKNAKQIILSTGMATLSEIEAALGVLAFGLTGRADDDISREGFELAYQSIDGRKALTSSVSILHCTTEYPAPPREINLRAMKTLERAFGLNTGYSDHSSGIHIPVAAAALGAKIIEKHFTLDKSLPGPDHKASLDPLELKAMVDCIREVELSLGSPIKGPTESEMGNRAVARKSLVVSRSTKEGEPLQLSCKRPGGGISPYDFWKWEGAPSPRDFEEDELLEE